MFQLAPTRASFYAWPRQLTRRDTRQIRAIGTGGLPPQVGSAASAVRLARRELFVTSDRPLLDSLRGILCGARGWGASLEMPQAGRCVSRPRVGLSCSTRHRGKLEEVVMADGERPERSQALSSTDWRMDKVATPPNLVKPVPSSVIRKRMW